MGCRAVNVPFWLDAGCEKVAQKICGPVGVVPGPPGKKKDTTHACERKRIEITLALALDLWRL